MALRTEMDESVDRRIAAMHKLDAYREAVMRWAMAESGTDRETRLLKLVVALQTDLTNILARSKADTLCRYPLAPCTCPKS